MTFALTLGREFFRRVESNKPRAGIVTNDVDGVTVRYGEPLHLRSGIGHKSLGNLPSPVFSYLLSNGNYANKKESNGQSLKTAVQSSSAWPESLSKPASLLVRCRMAQRRGWRHRTRAGCSPENFKDLAPLLVRQPGLSPRPFELGVDVFQERPLPARQVRTTQRLFDILS
ncbi:hypothetical protein [Rhizobium leguminosarum]|uniref:Uncharacterized protein n=1 Tax=Rhizobium leguminosarum TaxID=384 RepID=A0A2K9ZF14_RHILE|nr:hypothetical protein [Rhizobium leguminosarum]AUW46826.1 hypothetical protein CUJ84_pRLN2000284 [Rhizobium leguminosarum]